jgi:hypothetical protein
MTLDWFGAARGFMRDLDRELATKREWVCNGSAVTMEEYARMVGSIATLEWARERMRVYLSDDEQRALGMRPAGDAGSPSKKG